MKKIFLFKTTLFFCFSLFAQELTLPKGFKIAEYAKIHSPRQLARISAELVAVGTEQGEVYILEDKNQDFKLDKIHLLTDDLKIAAGVSFLAPHLYISDKNSIYKAANVIKNIKNPSLEVITDKLPKSAHHGKRYIKFSPDEKLYISVGAPCNICLEKNKYYGTITKLNLQNKKLEVFSWGVRNTVGFAWHPITKELWFTDNGRDWLGDNFPPDELNRAPKKGLHFGFPYLHGQDIVDTKYKNPPKNLVFTPPVQDLGAHNAALGMIFYTGKMFPKKYKNNIFIAEHGSWNRSVKSGYKVAFVKLDGNKAISYEPFITGWKKNNKVFGRPVDLLQLDDGSLLLSDDAFDIIYRISYAD